MDNQIYRAPESELMGNEPELVGDLASRGSRLLAAIIDGIISLIFVVPFMFFVGPMLGFRLGETTTISITYSVVGTIYSIAVFLLLHGYFLHKDGQTIGKKALNIKIVGLDGRQLTLLHLVGFRYLPTWIAPIIPYIGQLLLLVDILFIFGNERRCIHDYIANTRVVEGGIR